MFTLYFFVDLPVIEQWETKADQLESEVSKLEMDLSQLREAKEAEITTLKDDIANLNSEIKSLVETIGDLETKNEEVQTEIKRLERLKSDLQDKCDELRARTWDKIKSKWDTLDDLQNFLRKDGTNEYQYIKGTFDCEDFALTLQAHALLKGYIINVQLWAGGHVGNIAIIRSDSSVYWIEPQTDETGFQGWLD